MPCTLRIYFEQDFRVFIPLNVAVDEKKESTVMNSLNNWRFQRARYCNLSLSDPLYAMLLCAFTLLSNILSQCFSVALQGSYWVSRIRRSHLLNNRWIPLQVYRQWLKLNTKVKLIAVQVKDNLISVTSLYQQLLSL